MFLWMYVCITFYILFLWFWPFGPAIVYKNSPFPVVTRELYVGDVLSYRVSYCRYTSEPVLLVRELIDGVIYTLPPIISKFPQGCHDVTVARTVIPPLPEGQYTLSLVGRYKINALRWQTIEASTAPFQVLGMRRVP